MDMSPTALNTNRSTLDYSQSWINFLRISLRTANNLRQPYIAYFWHSACTRKNYTLFKNYVHIENFIENVYL